MRSNKRLLSWFRSFNRRYFKGRLVEPVIYFDNIGNYEGNPVCGQLTSPGYRVYRVVGKKWKCIEGRPEIRISTKLQPPWLWFQAKLTLLHEMAHLALPNKIEHGSVFQKEMVRLAKAGAFEGLW